MMRIVEGDLGDPRVVELCGLSGASAVWICNEHVSNDWFNLENQIRAAKLYDVDSIVRVEKGSYSDFVKPFEADATAIIALSSRAPTKDCVRSTIQPVINGANAAPTLAPKF